MTLGARCIVLAIPVLGWFFAGMQMNTTALTMRSASLDLLSQAGEIDLDRYHELTKSDTRARNGKAAELSEVDREQLKAWNSQLAKWVGWFVVAFLFGGAAGGWLFGRLGDAIGRSKALACSVLWYSSVALCCYLAPNLYVLLALWFLSSLGIGGTWPNGVSLVSEVWSKLSRPMVAGIMGASANVGLLVMGLVASLWAITETDWRWVFLISTAPAALAILAFFLLRESPRWLAVRDSEVEASHAGELFRSPFLRLTLVGILLATVPLLGGWGSVNWMIPWADEVGQAADPPAPHLKGSVGLYRSLAGTIGALLGGWSAAWLGRRRSYALMSLGSFACAEYAFWFTIPTDASFLYWVAALGFFSGVYFGWLPLFLPELFPTRIRATGAGVSFNFGRILTAVAVLATAALIDLFGGDYASIGRTSSWIFAIGIVAIWFAPDTTKSTLSDDG